MNERRWHAALAWLGGDAAVEDVLVETSGERISRVVPRTPCPPGAERVSGLMLPAFANAHSHAFHRALRGRAGGGDFWQWREAMYALAATLDPDRCFELARAAYAEMALAGVAVVGEFHYLHHRPGGGRYADRNEMGRAHLAAAAEVGIRITLLDTCYLQGGAGGRPLEGPQARFGDGSVDAWAARVAALEESATVRVGAAVHSVRALAPDGIGAVAGWAAARGRPLHFHLAEQRREHEECVAATGRTPTEVLARAGALGPGACAVHATHLPTEDVLTLGRSSTAVCLCPTTERDLGDGIGPSAALAAAGSPMCLGSDSHAVVDLVEEARALEMDQRLLLERRGVHRTAELLRALTAGGRAALGWEAGGIEAGGLADLVVVGLDSPRLAGAGAGTALSTLVAAGGASDVDTLIVGGRTLVRGGRHVRIPDVPDALRRALARLDPPPG